MTRVPDVTDHAVLRFLERECGVPVETVRRLMALRAATGASYDVFPAGRRVKIVLDNGVVVTTLKRGWTPREAMQREARPARREGRR